MQAGCKPRDSTKRHRAGLRLAAGLWSSSYDEFDRLFTDRAGGNLATTVMKATDLEDAWDQDAFRQAVTRNLETGRFDLVIAVDSITEELKRVVRYLNEHTVSEVRVLALELDHRAADGDVEVLVPTVYGEESATRKNQGTARHVWDEGSFFGPWPRSVLRECRSSGVSMTMRPAVGRRPLLGSRRVPVPYRVP